MSLDENAAEAARNWMYGKDTTLASLQVAFKDAIEKAFEAGRKDALACRPLHEILDWETGYKAAKAELRATHATEKISPLPWRRSKPDGKFNTTDIVDRDGNLIANVQSIPYRTTGKADADYIVKACNKCH